MFSSSLALIVVIVFVVTVINLSDAFIVTQNMYAATAGGKFKSKDNIMIKSVNERDSLHRFSLPAHKSVSDGRSSINNYCKSKLDKFQKQLKNVAVLTLISTLGYSSTPLLNSASNSHNIKNCIVQAAVAAETSSSIEEVPLFTQRSSDLQQFSDVARGFKMQRPFGFNEFDGAGGGYAGIICRISLRLSYSLDCNSFVFF